jgi:peptidoglycan/xylan/chitin deacetylase (PgdA/CDA1 family)
VLQRLLKQRFLEVVAQPAVGRLLARRARGRGLIFMLHRFACEENGWAGHDVRALRQLLGYLRAAGVQLVSVDEFLAAFEAGVDPASPPRVAFTVDDGYADFGHHGVPAFAEYDCPSTVFVVPGAIHQTLWFWWNQVEYLLRQATVREFACDLGGERLALRCGTVEERAAAGEVIEARLKQVDAAAVPGCLSELAEATGVTLPARTPDEYAVHDWETLRRLGAQGVSVGAHTMTHPILSRCDAERSRFEIRQSIDEVTSRCPNHSATFCFPNGRPDLDFGDREIDVLRASPARWALASTGGAFPSGASPDQFFRGAARFRIPRSGLEENVGRAAWLALVR